MILQAKPVPISARHILATLDLPRTKSRPPLLILMVGLPGSGKSLFARRLAPQINAVVLVSDALRMTFFPHPTYSSNESRRLFRAIQEAAEALLRQDFSVIIDATNLSENNRRPIRELAAKASAGLFVVQLEAPRTLIEQRLAGRAQGLDPQDKSEADMTIYDLMERQMEPPASPDWRIDTSDEGAVDQALHEIAAAYQAFSRQEQVTSE